MVQEGRKLMIFIEIKKRKLYIYIGVLGLFWRGIKVLGVQEI